LPYFFANISPTIYDFIWKEESKILVLIEIRRNLYPDEIIKYLTHNQVVPGSSPGGPTKFRNESTSSLRGAFLVLYITLGEKSIRPPAEAQVGPPLIIKHLQMKIVSAFLLSLSMC